MIINDCYKYIKNVLQTYDKPATFVEDVPESVELCKAWYTGFVKKFHEYYINTGKGNKTLAVKLPMGMAKKVCEDYANLLCNEKCDIVINQKEQLDNLLNETHTWVKLNNGIEIAFALGYGCMVQGVKNLKVNDKGVIVDKSKAKITNTFVNATAIRPLTFDEDVLQDVAFIFESTNSYRVVIHIKDTREYLKPDPDSERLIPNANFNLYDIVNIELKAINNIVQERSYTFHTLSERPCFQLIGPNTINNKDIGSPLRLSILANCIDTLKAIDNAYDSLNNEIQLGRKRVVADVDTFTEVDADGNNIEVFDPNDVLIYQVPAREGKIGEENKQLLQDISGQLRVQEILSALNEQLNVLSSKVGMGENYYNYEIGKRIATATQVISENGQLFRSIKKHEILLEDALKEMVLSLVYLNNNFTNNPAFTELGYNDIQVQFDDSIIEDTEAQKTSDRADVASGILSKAEYRMKYYGESEEEATEKLFKFNVDMFTTKAELLTPLLNDGLISAETFVKLAYAGLEKIISWYDETKFITEVEDAIESNKAVPSPFMLNADENPEQDETDETNLNE